MVLRHISGTNHLTTFQFYLQILAAVNYHFSHEAWSIHILPFYTSQANSPNHFNLFNEKHKHSFGNNGAPHHCLWTLYQHICSDYRGVLSLFCLWIAVRYRLSWAWRTCPPSYRLSYFLFKIYMKNGNAKTVCINILFYPVVVLLSIRWLSICICVKNSKRCHFEKWLKC